jgi:glycosyltransferase involved in cell wall biosynthesis
MKNRYSTKSKLRIAIVHDALCVPGGAERFVLNLSNVFPEAPIFTSVYLKDKTFPEFQRKDIRTLPFSRLIRSEKQFKVFYPLWLHLFKELKFSEFDRVISSSTYLAKYIQPSPEVDHKAYIHAPFRFLWKPESYSLESLPYPGYFHDFIGLFLSRLRKWDIQNTSNIQNIATNSQNMSNEILRIYNKNARVIHPPVSIDNFPLTESKGQYFLTVSRLISHKRVDLAIEACNRLGKSLVIVGDGPEKKQLETKAGETIRFAGRVSDQELLNLYQNSIALIFPGEEDFGIVPLEAQACGKPVIAYGKGGIMETVQDGITGIFFPQQNIDQLIDCLVKLPAMKFEARKIRTWASNFDIKKFQYEIQDFING